MLLKEITGLWRSTWVKGFLHFLSAAKPEIPLLTFYMRHGAEAEISLRKELFLSHKGGTLTVKPEIAATVNVI